MYPSSGLCDNYSGEVMIAHCFLSSNGNIATPPLEPAAIQLAYLIFCLVQ